MAKRFFIIDGHSQIYRAFFAPFRDLTSPSGEPTKATFVFSQMLLNLIDKHKPDYLAMALDSPVSTLERRAAYTDYKANRPPLPDGFLPQEARIIQIVRALGIPIWRQEGIEADDMLAAAAERWAGDDLDVVLVSRDKDLDQLLGPHVSMYDPMKDEFIDAARLIETKGYPPDKAVEVQTLTGDATDNIPGVSGIGPKTAAKLIAQYGSADEVIAHADELTPKQRENVLAFAAQLPLTRKLVTLRRDVPLSSDLEACRLERIDAEALLGIFEELGFSRLVERMRDMAGQTGQDEGRTPGAPASPSRPAGAAEVRQGPTVAADFDYRLIDTPEAFNDLADRLARTGRFAIDTETTDTRPMWAEMVGFSVAWEPGVGYYVPVRGPMGSPTVDLDLVRARLGPMLADPTIKKVGHNLKYDAIVLARAGMPVNPEGIEFDTYLAAFVLDAAASGKLDNVSMQYLNHRCIPISELIGAGAKAIRMDQAPTDAVATYAAEDAEVSLRLADVLKQRLTDEGLADLLGQVEMPLLSVLADMEMTGIKLDPAVLRRQETELAKQADVLRDRIMASAGVPFSPDSPRQLAEVLFERLKLPVVRRGKTGPSTDAGVLEILAAEHELPGLILDYRQLTKLLSTYLRALAECIHPRTHRVHASFNQAGAITGRLSSSDPNLQNIPIRSEEGRRIRSAFVADEGNLLLSADYSQIELRVLAHFCEDSTLAAAFERDQDIHRIVAGEVFGVPSDQVTPEQRARAKTVNFGIIYGQTAFGLAQTLRIGRAEAQDFIDRYRRRFPRIDAFLADCIATAKRQGYVETILKRRRPIADIASSNPARRAGAERMAINSVVQGSAADLIKLAMVNIHRRLQAERRPSRMLLQIHDELVFETPAEALEADRAMIVAEMEGAMTLRVPLKVDTGAGANWMDAK